MRERRLDGAFVIAAIAYAVVCWWPTRTLPYHWDAAAFVVDAARDLRASGFWPPIPGHTDFAHPPLLVTMVAGAWALFGESRLVAHLVILPFLPLLLVGTYAAGGRLAGRAVGAAAALVVGGIAVVLAETGEIYLDLPSAALVTCALAAWLWDRRGLAAGLFVAAALAKIPTAIVPAALLVDRLLDRGRRRDLRGHAVLLAPLAAIVGWLMFHRVETGWWLSRPGRAHAPMEPGRIVADARAVFGELLVAERRWLLLGAAVGGLVVLASRRRAPPRGLAPLALAVVGGAAFFSVMGEFGMRYAIFLLPPYALLACTLVRDAVRVVAGGNPAARADRATASVDGTSSREPPLAGEPPTATAARRATAWSAGIVGAYALVVFAALVPTWHPSRPMTTGYHFRPDDDLGYLDMISVGRQAAAFVEAKAPDAQVFGSFPESYQLTEPWQGYVQAPIEFAECRDFTRDPSRRQLVYVHGYSPGQRACKRLVDELGAHAVARFVSDDKWIELFVVPRR